MGNHYPLIIVAYFTKWSEGYVIPLQGTSTITDVLVTTFFCQIGILRELHTNKTGTLNCDSHGCYSALDTRQTTTLHPNSDGMMERYIKAMVEHLKEFI
jgi:hypothetical protein